MAKYINADALMEEYNLDKATKYGNETREEQSFSYSTMMMYEIADMIENAPTADVRPNVRGKWIKTENVGRFKDTLWKCSECGCDHVDDIFCISGNFNFCPNCGADMRGEEHG